MARAGDPVRSGLVPSLAHPGGNLTGLSYNNADLGPKRVQLLREIIPAMSHVAVLSNADNPGHTPQITELERASSELGIKLQSLVVRGPADFAPAFQAAARARAEALLARIGAPIGDAPGSTAAVAVGPKEMRELLQPAHGLRWVRGVVLDGARWGLCMGRLRWLAQKHPSAKDGKLGELLVPDHAPGSSAGASTTKPPTSTGTGSRTSSRT